MQRPPLVLLALTLPAARSAAQEPGVVDPNPPLPPTVTYPVFVDDADGEEGPGTDLSDIGTGRGQAWIDVVGPDPADPGNPAKIGPPDGILDLVQTNSNSPALPLGSTEATWLTPPVGVTNSPCYVYRGAADGTLTDVTDVMAAGTPQGFGVKYPGGSPWGVVGADYDDDGDTDLFYPCGAFNFTAPNNLSRNNGDGTFTNVSVASGIDHVQSSYGACWLDFDRDGDLDLYQTNAGQLWQAGWQGPEFPNPYDRLYRNEGDATFTEVGIEAKVNLASSSFTCASSDLDRDGWPEIVVSCFRQYNKVFYNNQDGTFSFMAPADHPTVQMEMDEVLLWDPGAPGNFDFLTIPAELDTVPVLGKLSIPVEIQDFNGDGWPDVLYGNWSVQIEDDETESALGALFDPWDRAYLYLNKGDQDGDGVGDGDFREAAVEVGIGHVGGCMGMMASDWNGDGYLDVYFGGGGPELDVHLEEDYLYVAEGASWPMDFQANPDGPLGKVFWEVGALAGTYANINMAHGATSRLEDGRLHAVIANGGPGLWELGQPNNYFRNTGNADGSTPSYLSVELEAVASPPGAYGAVVDVVRDGGSGPLQWPRAQRHAGLGFSSHNDAPPTFGLGSGGALALNVLWPSGVRQGALLWPNVGQPEVSLVEETLSLGFDVAYPEGGGVQLSVDVEETGPVPRGVHLFFLVLTPQLPGVFVPALFTQILPPTTLLPGVPLSFGGPAASLAPGAYAILAIEPGTTDVLTAATVWHDPATQSATSVPPDDAPAAAEHATLPQPFVGVGTRLAFRAERVRVSPARVPFEWTSTSLAGEGELALGADTRLAWRDGAAVITTRPGAATLSFNGDEPVLSLDAPLVCCDVACGSTQRALLRFEGLAGPFDVDGRRLDPDGRAAAEDAQASGL